MRASQARFVPSSTFLTSSTACSSTDLRGFISPRNHVQGSLFRGFPWQVAARARRPPLPSCRLRGAPAPSFTHGLQNLALAFRALLCSPVRRKPRWFRPRPARSPRELFSFLGFSFAHRESDLHRSLRPQPFTALVVLSMCNLTCSCEPAYPVQGSWPAAPCRLAPSLCCEAAPT
jgi:hypothetical protein